MKITIHHDDFGLTHGFTEAAYLSCNKHVANSLSLRVNGTAFYKAKTLAKQLVSTGVEIGLHLNLTDGPTLLDALANRQGHYKFQFWQYFFLTIIPNPKLEKLITAEIEAQYKAVGDLPITGIDSHNHVHQIPRIFRLTCIFCQKHQLSRIRLVREPFFIVLKKPFAFVSLLKWAILNFFSIFNRATAQKYGLETTDLFCGVLHTNQMTYPVYQKSLSYAQSHHLSSIEILSHPAIINHPDDQIYTSSFIRQYANSVNRRRELEAVIKLSKTKKLNLLRTESARLHNQAQN